MGSGIDPGSPMSSRSSFSCFVRKACSASGLSSGSDHALPRGRSIQDELRGRLAVFPILQDRIGLGIILFIAAVISLVRQSFLIQAVMIPFLIFSLAAIGLNLLTGYTGLLSLGTGAFMGVGAYACYKLTTSFPT